MSSRPLLYMIDGHSLAYRHFHAYSSGGEVLTTSTGIPTNATFGFARSLMDILEKDKPHYLTVTFDEGLSGRDTLYGDYKGTRDKMPDDLVTQMGYIRRLVEAFNIPTLTCAGYEADDVMGTIAAQAEAQDVDVQLVTGDGDILQLLTPRVRVRLRVRRKDGARFVSHDVIYDEARFQVEYNGLLPPQLVDWIALVGDPSDNIPGVAGIGDKTATQLLLTYGTLENLYDHLDEIKGAMRQKLIDGREKAFISKQLAAIRRDVPVTLDLAACVAHDFDKQQVEALYYELEFTSLFRQLDRIRVDASGESAEVGETSAAAAPHEQVETVIVDDMAKLAALVDALNGAALIAFDTETTSTDQMSAALVGIALAVDGERGYYVPVGHGIVHESMQSGGSPQMLPLTFGDEPAMGRQLPLDAVIEALRPPLTNPAIPKAAHNAPYDLVVMQRYGIDVAPIMFDTMVAEWLCDPNSATLGLKALASRRLKVKMTEITELLGTGKKQVTMDKVPIEYAAPYAAADAAMTYRLVEPLQDEMTSKGVADLFTTLEMPLVPVLAAMERAGVLLDTDFLREMSKTLTAQLADLERDIRAMTGMETLNVNSPKQLNEALFDKLGLKAAGVRKTTHGFSTAVDVLEDLRGEHPVIEKILEYRELSKLQGTYVDALPALINPQTGRVHTSYNQAGANTGRLSSSNPNLQNIPIRTEIGREVRRAFITPPGTVLLSVDYSQVELRILAHIAQEPRLLDAFAQGLDIHAATAAAVYGIPLESVTKEQRMFAKRVNFGLLYGMGAFRLARESNLTFAEAEDFIAAYFQRLPNVQKYIEDAKRLALTQGYLTTLFGRRRYFPDMRSPNQQTVRRAEREAINMPIQGTAADIIKRAMVDLYAELTRSTLGARMILQVHDELVLEAPERELRETAALVVRVMEGAYKLDAPLKANAQYGHNWLDLEDVES